jgi:hypothetical protein
MTQSSAWLVQPRPTHPFGFGRPLLSHSRGSSVAPPASTTTCASSSKSSPVRVSRQRTPRAIVRPGSCSNSTWVTNASGRSSIGFPPRAQRSADSAIGTYELSVERLALRLRGARRGWTQPWKQWPQNVHPRGPGVDELGGGRRSPSGAARLQDRVLLRPEGIARDVLAAVERQTDPLCALEEDGLLGPHRGGLDGQGVLDPTPVQ